MKKRLTGIAAALTASLMFTGAGATYGATLTLAGFGADQTVEEAPAKADASQNKIAVQKVTAVQEEPAAQDETKVPEETATQEESAAQEEPKVQEESTVQEETTAQEEPKVQEETAAQEETVQEETAAQTEAQTEKQTELDRSMVDTTGFAKGDGGTVNVRISGDTEGEIVGSLSLNDSVYIEDVDENGWYKIRSGNVEGYVAGYLIATGEEAEAVAKDTAYTYASVGAETLNIRSDASQDAEVVDMAGQDANLEVVEDLGDWVKVVTDNGVYGYVSADYVSTQTVYPTGETVQEQSEREEQEYLAAVAQQEAEYAAYLAEQEAAAASAGYTEESWVDATNTDAVYTDATNTDAAYTDTTYTDTTYTDTTYTDDTYTDTTYTDTTMTAASAGDVDALYQAYLAAQENAMTATDEADATAKANAAIEAYNAYLAACGSTDSVATLEASSTDDAAYTEDTYTDAAAADTTYTDDTYTDTTYTEDASAAESYESSSSSSGSSIGAQVANYALQFVGNPYVYGGSSLTGGTDCSGFTMSVYANFGVGLPHNAAAQSGCGTPVSLSDLQAGDLLFYGDGGIGHVAIYCGDGTVVHASNPETGIKTSAYNYRSPVAAVRLV